MAREIKFRGKSTNGNGWVYGYLIRFMDREAYILSHDETDDSFDKIKVRPESVGQFTGLIDQTKSEIYEDDFLKGGIYLSYQVKWDAEQLGWNIGLNAQHNFRVIGNVTDNPELLN